RGPLVEEVVRADAETGVERRHRVVQLDVVVHGPAHGRVGAGGLIYVQGDEPVDPTRLPLRAKVPLDPVERRLTAPPGDIAELRTIGAGIIDGLRAGLAGRGIVVVRRRIGRVESYLERTGIHAAQVEVRKPVIQREVHARGAESPQVHRRGIQDEHRAGQPARIVVAMDQRAVRTGIVGETRIEHGLRAQRRQQVVQVDAPKVDGAGQAGDVGRAVYQAQVVRLAPFRL